MLREERNNEMLKYVNAKLVRKNQKLNNITDWFLDKDEMGGKVGEALTFGTDENMGTVLTSTAIPAAPLAIGAVSLLAGMIVIFPLLGGPGTTETERIALEKVSELGGNILEFSGKSLGLSFKLASVPLGITALSIPKKLFRMLTDKVDEKTYPYIANNDNIISLIDDLLAKKDDPTLKFPALFLKRVDLRNNSEKINTEILGHLAYYRFCLQGIEEGTKTMDDLRDAYESFVAYLESVRKSLFASKEFKHNRFVNLLIDDETYTPEDFISTKKVK